MRVEKYIPKINSNTHCNKQDKWKNNLTLHLRQLVRKKIVEGLDTKKQKIKAQSKKLNSKEIK